MDPLFCPECGEAVEVLAYDTENADYDILICPGCDAQGWRCTIASLDEPDEEPGEDFHLDARARSYGGG